jgi:hypothetical protein
MSPAELALAALQTLVQLGITAEQVATLLNGPELTVAQVQAQLDATDAIIASGRQSS